MAHFLARMGTSSARRNLITKITPTTAKRKIAMGKRRSPFAASAEPHHVAGMYCGPRNHGMPRYPPPRPPRPAIGSIGGTSPTPREGSATGGGNPKPAPPRPNPGSRPSREPRPALKSTCLLKPKPLPKPGTMGGTTGGGGSTTGGEGGADPPEPAPAAAAAAAAAEELELEDDPELLKS